MSKKGFWLILMWLALLAFEAGEGVASAATLYVGSCGSPREPRYTSIQLAVNAASPGDTIRVCPGTYDEQVTVDKSLTLLGRVSRGRGAGPEAPVVDGGGGAGTGISIEANGVTVEGFKIRNFFDSAGCGAGAGIAACDVNNVSIVRNTISGNNWGVSVDFLAGCSPTWPVVPGTSSSVYIVENVIESNEASTGTCGGAEAAWQSGGIGVTAWYWGGAGLTISNNYFEDHDRNAILAGPGTGLVVANNTMTGDGWFAVEADDTLNASISNNSISCAYIDLPQYWPVGGVLAFDYGFVYGVSSLTMTGLNVAGNAIAGTCDSSIGLTDGVMLLGTPNFPIDGAQVAGNSITGVSKDAILLWNGSGGITNTAAHFNDLSDAGAYGLENQVGELVEAQWNWWGCSSGPNTDACSKVTGDVNYTPWLRRR